MNYAQFLAGNSNLLFLALVFASAVLFALTTANLTSNWFGLRKRATLAKASEELRLPSAERASAFLGTEAAGILAAVLPQKETEKSELRQFLMLAGFQSVAAPATYQLVRIILGAALGLATPLVVPSMFPNLPFAFILGMSTAMAGLGYMLPKSLVSLRRDSLISEHRNGFPDLMDLLVICIEAGISIEAAIDRTAKEFSRSYPSLSRNLQFMTGELRAGRSVRDALSNLAGRLGIDEARAFATLVQQSEELGSSLVQTLRVYSAEMREKRYARAEAKAYGLPVKMVIPLGLFCFPAIMGVTLFPIALRIAKEFSN